MGALVVGGLSLAGFAAAALSYFSSQSAVFLGMMHNADLLLTEDLYRHAVRGNDFSRWAWSAATYWFPDSTLYFAVRQTAGDLRLAWIAYALLQVVLFTAGMILLARVSLRSFDPADAALLAACGSLYLAGAPLWAPGAQYLLGSVLHGGVALALLAALTLVVRLVAYPAGGRALPAGALGVLLFLMCLSDMFTVPQVLAPIVLVLAYVAWRVPGLRRRAAAVSALALAAGAGGYALDRHWRTTVDNLTLSLSLERMTASLAALADTARQLAVENPLHLSLIGAWFAVLLAAVVWSARRLSSDRPYTHAVLMVNGVLAAHVIIELVFVVVTGVYADSANLRYLDPLLVLPTGWGFALLALQVLDGRRHAVRAQAAASVLISAAALATAAAAPGLLDGVTAVATYYPPSVACLDTQLSAAGVTRGIATYWQARPVALFSRAGLTVAQISAELSPFYWENDLGDYDIEPQFVLLDRRPGMPREYVIDEKRVRARYGAPAAVIDCPDARALVYGRPGDTALRNLFKGAMGLASFRHAGNTYTYHPANLPGGVGRVDGLARSVDGGGAGILTFGPFVPLPPGDYTAVIDYDARGADGPVGTWDVSISRPPDGAIVARGALPVGGTSATGDFHIDASTVVEIRTFYGGSGSLSVSAITLTRVR